MSLKLSTAKEATGPSVRSLGSVERVSLAVPQPNPFSRSTRFAVTVAQACRLEVGIYDLAGREVRHPCLAQGHLLRAAYASMPSNCWTMERRRPAQRGGSSAIHQSDDAMQEICWWMFHESNALFRT